MQNPIDVHKIFAGYFQGCESLAYALSVKPGKEEYKVAWVHFEEVFKKS